MCDKLRGTIGHLALDLSFIAAIRFLQVESGESLSACLQWANKLALLDPTSRLAITRLAEPRS